METPTVLVTDDHEVVRKGLISLFAGSSLAVCGEAATADEAVHKARKLRPDVVLLDVRLGDSDGLDCIRRIRAACAAGTRRDALSLRQSHLRGPRRRSRSP